ncbi:MAG: hypothetical protein QOC93_1632 [Actinomycetota bacterium]|jgi:hypothetical protein|nr:hypothetical protein [Cryptosporangiaceae bacterium]MDQ1676488.1 hypothetical protein [Actinomycetota bacterium]
MSEPAEGDEPVTDADRAEELAEGAGVDPTPEQIAEYQRLAHDPAAPSTGDEPPEPLEPPD